MLTRDAGDGIHVGVRQVCMAVLCAPPPPQTLVRAPPTHTPVGASITENTTEGKTHHSPSTVHSPSKGPITYQLVCYRALGVSGSGHHAHTI
jgi:hypothetical protein